jgi:hypothetical protein
MAQTDSTAKKTNDVSSVHHYRGYITDVELVTPKADAQQKREPKPYYSVKATLHNGRSSKNVLKYIYPTMYVSEEVTDVIEDVFMQLQAQKKQEKEGETFSLPCNMTVVNVVAKPYMSRGKVGVNWVGTISGLEVINKDEA